MWKIPTTLQILIIQCLIDDISFKCSFWNTDIAYPRGLMKVSHPPSCCCSRLVFMSRFRILKSCQGRDNGEDEECIHHFIAVSFASTVGFENNIYGSNEWIYYLARSGRMHRSPKYKKEKKIRVLKSHICNIS